MTTTRIDERWYARAPDAHAELCAGGVVARVAGSEVLIALVREMQYQDFFLPKGRVEPGETLEAAARREIEEEAGLTDLTLLAELGAQERYNFPRTSWKRIHYFLFTTEAADGAPTDELHDYRLGWFPLDELPAIFWPEQRRLLDEEQAKIVAAVGA